MPLHPTRVCGVGEGVGRGGVGREHEGPRADHGRRKQFGPTPSLPAHGGVGGWGARPRSVAPDRRHFVGRHPRALHALHAHARGGGEGPHRRAAATGGRCGRAAGGHRPRACASWPRLGGGGGWVRGKGEGSCRAAAAQPPPQRLPEQRWAPRRRAGPHGGEAGAPPPGPCRCGGRLTAHRPPAGPGHANKEHPTCIPP